MARRPMSAGCMRLSAVDSVWLKSGSPFLLSGVRDDAERLVAAGIAAMGLRSHNGAIDSATQMRARKQTIEMARRTCIALIQAYQACPDSVHFYSSLAQQVRLAPNRAQRTDTAMQPEFFHLTQIASDFQLEEMLQVGEIPARILAAIPGLRGETHLGWRRVATAAAGLLALGLGYHVVFGQNGLTAYEQKRQEYQELDSQLRSLQRENDLLKGHVERLQNDPDAIEQQAREELHYTRSGEIIYTFLTTPSASPDSKK